MTATALNLVLSAAQRCLFQSPELLIFNELSPCCHPALGSFSTIIINPKNTLSVLVTHISKTFVAVCYKDKELQRFCLLQYTGPFCLLNV